MKSPWVAQIYKTSKCSVPACSTVAPPGERVFTLFRHPFLPRQQGTWFPRHSSIDLFTCSKPACLGSLSLNAIYRLPVPQAPPALCPNPARTSRPLFPLTRATRTRHTGSPSCATLGCNDLKHALRDLPPYDEYHGFYFGDRSPFRCAIRWPTRSSCSTVTRSDLLLRFLRRRGACLPCPPCPRLGLLPRRQDAPQGAGEAVGSIELLHPGAVEVFFSWFAAYLPTPPPSRSFLSLVPTNVRNACAPSQTNSAGM